MSSAFEKLLRILGLESDQKFDNRGVIGGLDRFMIYWAKEAREEAAASGDPEAERRVERIISGLVGYDELGRDVRQERVEAARAELDRAAAPDTSTAPDSGSPAEASADVSAATIRDETLPVDADVAPASGVDQEQETAGSEAKGPEAAEPDAEPAAVTPQPQRPEPAPTVETEDAAKPAPSLDVPVTSVRGIGPVLADKLGKLGIHTVRDLLYHFPRRYEDYGELRPINKLDALAQVTVVGVVRQVSMYRTRKKVPVVSVTLADASGAVEARFYGQPYLRTQFRQGNEIVISGQVKQHLGRLYFDSPAWEQLQPELLHTRRIVPTYALTSGLSGKAMRRHVKSAVDSWAQHVIDPMPEDVRKAGDLMDLQTAIVQIHFPTSQENLAKARERLCYDELLLLQLGILRHRHVWRSERGRVLHVIRQEIDQFIGGLPFVLTGAQAKAVDDILFDLQQPVPMSRLLQGDVGSGKTIVALIAMLATARNGLQAALMAPTSVLAQQHYQTISLMLEGFKGIHCVLLEGSMSAAEKDAVRQEVASGRAQIVVGTHALIQDSVDFQTLGLVVVDEQHRFGVAQRDTLRSKGGGVRPHLLAMSATPIPRSLALTVYGDLDVSILDELPPHRQSVITAVRNRRSRERIYRFVAAEVREGRQAFVICPLVEETEDSDGVAAVQERERLQRDVFPDLRLGLMHGRLSPDEKDAVMAAFKAGEYDILVSTSVIEVGIDIPNASVILIEGADRFGLAQLHQFRGRVGRGEFKSYCILMAEDPSATSIERLQIMEATNDGFVLAEKDLEMRGPGDFLGVRQSGLPALKVAQLSDMAVLAKARAQAQLLLADDPDLEQPQHVALGAQVRHFWQNVDLS